MVAKSKIKDEERDVIRVQMSISRHTSPEIFNELLPLETGQRPERIRALMTLGWNEINKHKYFSVLSSGNGPENIAAISSLTPSPQIASNTNTNTNTNTDGESEIDQQGNSHSGLRINDGWGDDVTDNEVQSQTATPNESTARAVSKFMRNAGK